MRGLAAAFRVSGGTSDVVSLTLIQTVTEGVSTCTADNLLLDGLDYLWTEDEDEDMGDCV